MIDLIIKAAYFFLPAYFSNMMPVFVKRINFLNYPVDFEKTWNKKRILGSHKTFRGFFFGVLSAAIIFEIQRIIYNQGLLKGISLIDYSSAPFFLGALIGFSALLGDSVKSFFKRRFDIRPGKPWVPFDQLDFMIFAILITLPWNGLTMFESFIVMTVIFMFTIIFQYIGYKLGLKKDKL